MGKRLDGVFYLKSKIDTNFWGGIRGSSDSSNFHITNVNKSNFDFLKAKFWKLGNILRL